MVLRILAYKTLYFYEIFKYCAFFKTFMDKTENYKVGFDKLSGWMKFAVIGGFIAMLSFLFYFLSYSMYYAAGGV